MNNDTNTIVKLAQENAIIAARIALIGQLETTQIDGIEIEIRRLLKI